MLAQIQVEDQDGALSILDGFDENFILGWLFLTINYLFLRILKPSAYLRVSLVLALVAVPDGSGPGASVT